MGSRACASRWIRSRRRMGRGAGWLSKTIKGSTLERTVPSSRAIRRNARGNPGASMLGDLALPDFALLASVFARILLALVLTLPIAREREHHDVSAGLRTFPIVAIGACGLVILA